MKQTIYITAAILMSALINAKIIDTNELEKVSKDSHFINRVAWLSNNCSATLINEKYAITAKHCVENSYRFPLVYPSLNSGLLLFKPAREIEEVLIYPKHHLGEEQDLAILKLKREYKDFDIESTQNFSANLLNGDRISIAGYFKGNSKIYTTQCNFNIDEKLYNSNYYLYKCDSTPGMSGSGVFNDLGELVGVHVASDSETNNNVFLYLDDEMKRYIREVIE